MANYLDKYRQSICNHGLNVDQVYQQIRMFERGTQFTKIVAPATPRNGIKMLSDAETRSFESLYQDFSSRERVVKFVPASGAASRMFQFLHQFLADGVVTDEIDRFLSQQQEFPFQEKLAHACEKDEIPFPANTDNLKAVVQKTLDLFGNLPKGLVPFHHTPHGPSTPFEDHLAEATAYASRSEGTASLHFTVAPNFKAEINNCLNQSIKSHYSHMDLQIELSFQDHTSDTVAVDEDNRPVEHKAGQLLFRPGGHGALIENLNKIDAPLIFIKNIDNVAAPQHLEAIAQNKRVLAGYALSLQTRIFNFLDRLDDADHSECLAMVDFLKQELGQDLTEAIQGWELGKIRSFLLGRLNRPLRVCGMVRQEGQPGGGPFWVAEAPGIRSLQIVEMSQIDGNDPDAMQLVSAATHFNPVDLVCLVRDRFGQRFDLSQFIDSQAYFIAKKSHQGSPIKALEWPGLWNGAMAFWNTAFVEVPMITFNPVKTVLDLLNPGHAGK